jgi:streptomycin 6-kinase
MTGREREVGDVVRRKAEALGDAGAAWLRDLPAVVAELEREWSIRVGDTLPGGTEGYVAASTGPDEAPTVLKVALPGEAATGEVEALRTAAGEGYVRLLRHDPDRHAMLQERLGPRLAELDLPVRRQHELICATLRRAWAVPPSPALWSGAEKAASLSAFVTAAWEALDRPCPERVVAQAVAFAETRRHAFDPDGAVLVHGDAHAHNLLLRQEADPDDPDAFRLIDPDGLWAEPACDLAVPMREDSEELLSSGDVAGAAQERCAFLSQLTGVEETPIWEWGFVERVSTGLLGIQVGMEHEGRAMLEVAEALS